MNAKLKKDIIMGLTLLSGSYAFIAGEFIISTVMFASAAIYTNVVLTRLLNK